MPRLLAPRWLVGHVLVLVAAVVMVLLSRWQWHRAQHTHSLQNWSYAVEWVLFAGFTLVAYARIARDEGQEPSRPAPPLRVGAPPAPPVEVSEEEDPELAAYNRYLTDLHARSQS